jgi:hypothetical protein
LKKKRCEAEKGETMKIEKIDPICFAVKDLEETKRAYKEDFGLVPKYEYVAESSNAHLKRLQPGGNKNESVGFRWNGGDGPGSRA